MVIVTPKTLNPQSRDCGATAFGLWLSRPPGRGRHDLRIVAPATVFGLWCHSLRAVAVGTPRVAAATIFGSWLHPRSSDCGATAFGLWLSRPPASRPPRSSDRGSIHGLRAVVPQPSGCGCRDPPVAATTIFGSWLLPQSSGCSATAFGLWLSRPPVAAATIFGSWLLPQSSGCGAAFGLWLSRHDLRIVAPVRVLGLWCRSPRVAAATIFGSWLLPQSSGCGATAFGLWLSRPPASRPPRSSDRGSCHSLPAVVPQLRAVAVATPGSWPPRSSDRGSCHSLRTVVTAFGLWTPDRAPATVYGLWSAVP